MGGIKDGFGMYYFADGDRYEGQYVKGKMQGIGIFFGADGDRYEGFYQNDLQNGDGVYYYANGSHYEGQFKDGKYDGKGILYNSDGSIMNNGIWKSGEYEKSFPLTPISVEYFENLADEIVILSKKSPASSLRRLSSLKLKISEAMMKSVATPTRKEGLESVLDVIKALLDPTKEIDAKLRLKEDVPQKSTEIKTDIVQSNNSDKPNQNLSFKTEEMDISVLENIARATGRKLEDVLADLTHDGMLNYSAGSDAKSTEFSGQLDQSRYRTTRHLKADGGFAEVYLGRDSESGNDIVWKQAAPSRQLSASKVNDTLINEIEILKSLEHPRIPKYIDSGLIENNDGVRVQVLIMEYIEGTSLNQEMKAVINGNFKQKLERIISYMSECCEVLEYMADLDMPIYHRDIKPHNIMLSPKKGVVLIDFGLSKGVDAGEGISKSGGAHTRGWSPPERERGVTGSFTDVYGLGQILWHLLTNEDAGIFSSNYRTKKIIESGHPSWLAELVNLATIPDNTSKRIQSIFEFRIMLEDGFLNEI